MAEIVGVRFKEVGKVYYFDPDGVSLKKATELLLKRPAELSAARSPWIIE